MKKLLLLITFLTSSAFADVTLIQFEKRGDANLITAWGIYPDGHEKLIDAPIGSEYYNAAISVQGVFPLSRDIYRYFIYFDGSSIYKVNFNLKSPYGEINFMAPFTDDQKSAIETLKQDVINAP